jgi:hypothetical protein
MIKMLLGPDLHCRQGWRRQSIPGHNQSRTLSHLLPAEMEDINLVHTAKTSFHGKDICNSIKYIHTVCPLIITVFSFVYIFKNFVPNYHNCFFHLFIFFRILFKIPSTINIVSIKVLAKKGWSTTKTTFCSFFPAGLYLISGTDRFAKVVCDIVNTVGQVEHSTFWVGRKPKHKSWNRSILNICTGKTNKYLSSRDPGSFGSSTSTDIHIENLKVLCKYFFRKNVTENELT